MTQERLLKEQAAMRERWSNRNWHRNRTEISDQDRERRRQQMVGINQSRSLTFQQLSNRLLGERMLEQVKRQFGG